MESKLRKCNYCDEVKDISLFVRSPNKSGYGNRCKLCVNMLQRERRKSNGDADTKKYEKTPNGYLMRCYRNMLSRVKGIQKLKAHLYAGKDIITKESFYEWAFSTEDFMVMFNDYVASDFDQRFAPSVDRRDATKGYCIDNIRWLTHSENSRLGAVSKARKYSGK